MSFFFIIPYINKIILLFSLNIMSNHIALQINYLYLVKLTLCFLLVLLIYLDYLVFRIYLKY
jgi:hypothetical protein